MSTGRSGRDPRYAVRSRPSSCCSPGGRSLPPRWSAGRACGDGGVWGLRGVDERGERRGEGGAEGGGGGWGRAGGAGIFFPPRRSRRPAPGGGRRRDRGVRVRERTLPSWRSRPPYTRRASRRDHPARPDRGGAGRSVVASAPALGAGDRRFESCRPDAVHRFDQVRSDRRFLCGCSSMVEPQPSKLVMRVRFSSPAPRPHRVVTRGHRRLRDLDRFPADRRIARARRASPFRARTVQADRARLRSHLRSF